MVINKKEFVATLSEAVGVTKVDATKMYDFVFNALCAHIMDGNEVSIPSLGKFKIVERDVRMARNPQTGEEIEVPAHKVVKFAASKNIKDAVADL